jgi:hypothetical protein
MMISFGGRVEVDESKLAESVVDVAALTQLQELS